MDFKELEYFSTIVKCGNLTHAARLLYVSQPTLSKFLQKLEEDLGLVLFRRGSRRLKLTYAGQRYYAHVERILSQKREMDAEMTDGIGFLSGELLEHLELDIPFGAYPLQDCTLHIESVAAWRTGDYLPRYAQAFIKLMEQV